MSEFTTVTVQILGKPYQVHCPQEEVDALSASARYLDSKMAAIKGSGKIVGLDRIAVMAALNIANELLNTESSAQDAVSAIDSRVSQLSHRVEFALAKHRHAES
jgi:cell division protein ZapA